MPHHRLLYPVIIVSFLSLVTKPSQVSVFRVFRTSFSTTSHISSRSSSSYIFCRAERLAHKTKVSEERYLFGFTVFRNFLFKMPIVLFNVTKILQYNQQQHCSYCFTARLLSHECNKIQPLCSAQNKTHYNLISQSYAMAQSLLQD